MPPFSNTSVSGMLLWLKADSIGGASPVSTWADQSGNGNDATQPSTSNQPTLVTNALNGLPVVHFTWGQILNLPNVMNGATQGEIFAVVRSTGAPGVTGSLWDWGPGYGSAYPNSDGTLYEAFGTDGNYWMSLGKPAQNLAQFHVYNISSSPSEWTQRFDGLVNYDRTGSNLTADFSTSPILGGNGASFLTGDFAEIIVYNQALNQAQRDTVNAYLGNKYNIYIAPPVPANLIATALSSTQVSLQWTAPSSSSDVTYLVECSTNGGNFTLVASVDNGLSYINTGLTAGMTYTYRVQVESYTGTSGYSNQASATTLLSGTDMPLTPQQGLCLWLKADTGLNAASTGSGIDFWADQSGNIPGNNATQSGASGRPTLVTNSINGLPVVHFNGGQILNLPSNPMNGATQGEIFAVVRSTGAPGVTGSLWDWGAGYGSAYPNSDGTLYEGFGTDGNYWMSLGKPPQDITQYQQQFQRVGAAF
jgi:hypothetical protein